MATDTRVGTWGLNATKPEPAEEVLSIGYVADTGSDSTFDDDTRKVVHPTDVQPGGKYYSIVKIQIRYEKQTPDDSRWAHGTGWLIKPDILATAGHCVYDYTHSLGRAVEIKAYIGYNGKDSINHPGVQFRQGKAVVTTEAWLYSDLNRANDVAFVQLERPFDNVVPINFGPTPTRDELRIGVVGYPTDKTYMDERGAQMYEQFRITAFNLDAAELNMLEYTISTYNGQSGAPVLVDGRNLSLGAHVYGLGNKNTASVIKGKYGNFWNASINTLTNPNKSSTGFTFLTVPISQAESETENSTASTPSDGEDFWSTFKSVAGIGAPISDNILQSGSPFVGPVGGVAGALAGTLMGFAGKMTNTESSFGVGSSWKQPCARAILAEAALQTLLKMDSEIVQKYGLFDGLQQSYTKNKAAVKPMASSLGPALLGPILRVSQMNLSPQVTRQMDSSFPSISAPPGGQDSGFDSKYESFAQGIEREAGERESGNEDFGIFVNGVTRVGLSSAPVALGALGDFLGSSKGATLPFTPAGDAIGVHLETLYQRAIMADATLQSLNEIPAEEMSVEGLFGDLVDGVKKIGGTVIRVAPEAVKTIIPIMSAVKDGNSGEAGNGRGSAIDPSAGRQPADNAPKKKGRSIEDMLRDGTL